MNEQEWLGAENQLGLDIWKNKYLQKKNVQQTAQNNLYRRTFEYYDLDQIRICKDFQRNNRDNKY